jgi:sterol desaturase/sphingolipid hydroxylase (fatty acid hydroxylase superfamily)
MDNRVTMMDGRPLASVKSPAHQSWLLAISLTQWNYVLSVVADAAVAVVMLKWSAVALDRPGVLVPVGAAALLGYTLTEYSWHRFLFHWRGAPRSLREGHARHHRAPEGALALPFFTALPHGLVVWGLSASLIGSRLGAFFTGIWFLGYVAYSGVHQLVHSPFRHPLLTWLREVHDVHHTRSDRNFGVTSPLWDWVFGTWCPPKRG